MIYCVRTTDSYSFISEGITNFVSQLTLMSQLQPKM